jgi:hypothetical protein
MAGPPVQRHRIIEALQQIPQRLALGIDKPLVELVLRPLEVFIDKRTDSNPIEVLAEPFKRTRCSRVDVDGHGRDMKHRRSGRSITT